MTRLQPTAVYVHIPFCPSKCGYCDFNSFAMSGDIVERTARAIEAEIRRSPHAGTPAKTIFFGGGTPTFIPADSLLAILQAVLEVHPPIEGCEITSEANPGTVDSEKFKRMRIAGFNRLSIGAQSFHDDELLRLDRVHSAKETRSAVCAARDAGFENINLDLMFALPEHTRSRWRSSLESAIELDPEHLSLYCLTLEPNTRFAKLAQRGELMLPSEDEQVTFFEDAASIAEAAGYRQYEISNYARPGFECRHNLCYWRCEEYIAYGPGAVQRVGNARWTHIKHPVAYCDAVERGADLACERETLSEAQLRLERIMLGIRTTEGLRADDCDVNREGAAKCEAKGWISTEDGRIALTAMGRNFCNQVALELC